MKNLRDYLPQADQVLELEPEELGLVILRVLNARGERHYNCHNFAGNFGPHQNSGYPDDKADDIMRAVLEAWAWLESQVLLYPTLSGGAHGWTSVSRRGKQIVNDETAIDYRKGASLPWHLVHPKIATAARSSFLRGDYQTAVFQAFKEVEIEVRRTGGFADTDIGVPLMRKALDARSGPLTDQTLPEAEREALAHLAAGAIGSYKNPHSHRTVTLKDPTDAAEMIILASHLLRIVDSRISLRDAPPDSR